MKKIFTFLTLSLFWLPTFSYAQPLFDVACQEFGGTCRTNNALLNCKPKAGFCVSKTDVSVFVTGSEIQNRLALLGIAYQNSDGTIIQSTKPLNSTCSGGKCAFSQVITFGGLECGKTYTGNVKLINSPENISQTFSFQTLSCETNVVTVLLKNIVKVSDTEVKITTEVEDNRSETEKLSSLFLGFGYAQTDAQGASTVLDITNKQTKFTKEQVIDNLACDSEYTFIITARYGNPPNNTKTAPQKFTLECDPLSNNTDAENTDSGDNTYTFLTPLPLGEGLTPQDSVEIGAGAGGVLGILQRIFTIMLVAAVVLAVVFMIIGGARYATGDMLSAKVGGREIITNAVTGLLFALLAWLLLNIVNPDLLRFTLSIPNIGKPLTPGTGGGDDSDPGDVISGDSPCKGLSDLECFEKIKADESNVRGKFSAANIAVVGTVSGATPCAAYNEEGCTTVGLLNSTTITKLIEVKNDCVAANPGCKVQITGGTEYWNHGSKRGGNHGKFVAVDLQLTGSAFESFNTFIRTKKSLGSSDSCRAQFEYKGLLFCDEDIPRNADHWHVDTIKDSENGGQSGVVGAGDKKITNKMDYVFQEFNMSGGVRNATEYGSGTIKKKLDGAAKWIVPITEAVKGTGVEKRLLVTIVAIESDGIPGQDSGKGAYGLAQMKPATAIPLAKKLGKTLTTSEITTILLSKEDDDILFSLKMAALYLKEIKSNQPKFTDTLAGYNAGYGANAMGESTNCPDRKRWECPWESGTVTGGDICYDKSNPKKPLKTDCVLNADRIGSDGKKGGFEEARFYVVNGMRIYNQASKFE